MAVLQQQIQTQTPGGLRLVYACLVKVAKLLDELNGMNNSEFANFLHILCNFSTVIAELDYVMMHI